MKEFKSWKDIEEWAKRNGYKRIAKRVRFNAENWWSSGEFGRSQKEICDTMRHARTETARHEWAGRIERALEDDDVLNTIGV